jgi:hypothetical protein
MKTKPVYKNGLFVSHDSRRPMTGARFIEICRKDLYPIWNRMHASKPHSRHALPTASRITIPVAYLAQQTLDCCASNERLKNERERRNCLGGEENYFHSDTSHVYALMVCIVGQARLNLKGSSEGKISKFLSYTFELRDTYCYR